MEGDDGVNQGEAVLPQARLLAARLLVMPQMSKAELYAAIRRDHRGGMSMRELERKHGVTWRTLREALDSSWPDRPVGGLGTVRMAAVSARDHLSPPAGCGNYSCSTAAFLSFVCGERLSS
ncbi:hypothetical protein ACFU8Q_29815 [Streptomyces sp. NPDC057543]|uniref:hypothetical protein n=1 Tax=Streptomyces sp. NPDC057543 TaxID=3346163 RepID=UPI00368F9A1E